MPRHQSRLWLAPLVKRKEKKKKGGREGGLLLQLRGSPRLIELNSTYPIAPQKTSWPITNASQHDKAVHLAGSRSFPHRPEDAFFFQIHGPMSFFSPFWVHAWKKKKNAYSRNRTPRADIGYSELPTVGPNSNNYMYARTPQADVYVIHIHLICVCIGRSLSYTQCSPDKSP